MDSKTSDIQLSQKSGSPGIIYFWEAMGGTETLKQRQGIWAPVLA